METSISSNSEQPIDFGHLAIIASCAIILIGFSVLKNGFNLNLHPQARTVLTYEQARAQVLAEQGNSSSDVASTGATQAEQLAMIDPTLTAGAVLGASSGTLGGMLSTSSLESTIQADIPTPDQLLTPEALGTIKIIELPNTSLGLVTQYATQVANVEGLDGIENILNAMVGGDTGALKTIPPRIQKLVTDLQHVPAPKDLITYHKVKLLYYGALGNEALAEIGGDNAPDSGEVSTVILVLGKYLDSVKSRIFNTYGVQLP